tara:strand:- start:475 stop:783 length:309 start_codon:yes stop_codon:yes gene_type:complete
MNKQEMLEEYGDIPLKFKSWYKNEFKLTTADCVDSMDINATLLVVFAPDYRDDLGFSNITTIRELTQNDDHSHIYVYDGWNDEKTVSGTPKRKQVYYGKGEL